MDVPAPIHFWPAPGSRILGSLGKRRPVIKAASGPFVRGSIDRTRVRETVVAGGRRSAYAWKALPGTETPPPSRDTERNAKLWHALGPRWRRFIPGRALGMNRFPYVDEPDRVSTTVEARRPLTSGGDFTQAGGPTCANNIADGDGETWSASRRGTDGRRLRIRCAPWPSSKTERVALYAGGSFTEAGGSSAQPRRERGTVLPGVASERNGRDRERAGGLRRRPGVRACSREVPSTPSTATRRRRDRVVGRIGMELRRVRPREATSPPCSSSTTVRAWLSTRRATSTRVRSTTGRAVERELLSRVARLGHRGFSAGETLAAFDDGFGAALFVGRGSGADFLHPGCTRWSGSNGRRSPCRTAAGTAVESLGVYRSAVKPAPALFVAWIRGLHSRARASPASASGALRPRPASPFASATAAMVPVPADGRLPPRLRQLRLDRRSLCSTPPGGRASRFDSLTLTAARAARAASILLQGDAESAPTSFGQGLRCVGGRTKRLFVAQAVGGIFSVPGPGQPSISARSGALGDPLFVGAVEGVPGDLSGSPAGSGHPARFRPVAPGTSRARGASPGCHRRRTPPDAAASEGRRRIRSP
jgi:hypothetical protein